MKLVSLFLCRCFVIAFVASAALAPRSALAACSSPTGSAGDIIYNGTYNVLQYCNSTNWINAGSLGSSGGTLVAGDFCNNNGTLISCTTPYTGTGNIVLSASPTFTGSITAASSSWSGTVSGVNSTWTGQVAIGTTTTSGALNVSGTVTAATLSGAHTGSGSGLTGIGTASLGGITGTPSSTTFLAGNGAWTSLAGAGGVTGTGTTNYIPLWTSATALGTSSIYQSGSNVGIGTTSASTTLQVNGTATATAFSGSGASLTGIGTSNMSAITGTASSTTFLAGNGAWTALTTASLPALTSTDVWVGNGSNVATATATTGTGNVVMSASPTLSGTITGGTFSGSGASLTGIGTSNMSAITGIANSTTFLTGNGTWSTPAASLPSLTSTDVWVGNGSNVATATATTGTGNVVMSASPTFTGTITGGTFSGTHTGNGSGLTSIGTSSLAAVTGTGNNVVLAASPTFTGTVAGATSTWSSAVAIGTTTTSGALNVSGTATATTFSGSGASLTGIGTSNMSAITGTASSTTFLAGNGAWTALTTASLPALTSTDIWVGNGSNVATGVAMSGDCAIATSGAITCTKTSGASFGTLATASTVNLSSQASGTLQAAQFPALTGDVTTTAGAVATTVAKIQGTTVSGVTGTGNVVMSASPTLTGTITAATANFSGPVSYLFASDYSTATATQSDVAINTASAVRYTGAGSSTFYGIAAGTAGQILYLTNAATSTNTLTLSNQSASDSTAASRIITGSGADMVLANNSSAVLQYDGSASRWRVIGGSGGALSGGTTNEVPLWTSSTTLGTSSIYQSGSNIGIGTAAPFYKFQESGGPLEVTTTDFNNTSTGSNIYLNLGATTGNTYGIIGLATTGGTVAGNLAIMPFGGNVGIGITSPASLGNGGTPKIVQIHNVGANAYGDLELSSTSTTSGNVVGALDFGTTGSAGEQRSASIQSWLLGASSSAAIGDLQFYTSNGTTTAERMRIDNAGNVGIGNTGPSVPLDVTGSIRSSTYLQAGTGNVVTNLGPAIVMQDTGTAGKIDAANWGTGGHALVLQTLSGGNVGIGTTAPSTALQVNGTVTATTFAGNVPVTDLNSGTSASSSTYWRGDGTWAAPTASLSGGTTNYVARWTSSSTLGTGVLYDNGSGVGINTTSPTNPLQVLSGAANTAGDSLTSATAQVTGPNWVMNGSSSNGTFLVSTNDAAAVDVGGSIGFAGRYTGTQQATFAAIKGASENGSYNGYLVFGTRSGGQITERMRITGTGNVGIGTTSPTYTLDVNGSEVIHNAGGISFGGVNGSNGNNQGIWFDDIGNAGWGRVSRNSANGNLLIDPQGGANTIIGGTEGGSVGINTTSPGRNLSINGSNVYVGYNDSGAEKWAVGNESTVGDRYVIYSDTAGYVITALQSNGYVGIENTSPGYTLDVNGNINSNSWVYSNELFTRDNVYLGYLGDYISNRLNQAVTSGSSPNFYNPYIGYMGTSLSGWVNQPLLTTSSPTFAGISSSAQYIANVAGAQFRGIDSSYGWFAYSDSANFYILLTNSGNQYGSYNGLRPFYINEASGMVNMNNGLTVNGTATFSSNVNVGSGVFATNGDHYMAWAGVWASQWLNQSVAAGSSPNFYNPYIGYMGTNLSNWINQPLTTGNSPTFADLYLNNWVRINGATGIYWQSYGGGWYMQDSTYIRNYGSKVVYINSDLYANNFYHTSDRRLKKNIKPVAGLEIVDQLKGVTFDWKKDGKPSAGVIAQDIEPVFPVAVTTDTKGSKLVSYDTLIAPLIEAVKELHKLFDGVHTDIAKLNDENDRLRAANDNEAAQIRTLTARLDALEKAKK